MWFWWHLMGLEHLCSTPVALSSMTWLCGVTLALVLTLWFRSPVFSPSFQFSYTFSELTMILPINSFPAQISQNPFLLLVTNQIPNSNGSNMRLRSAMEKTKDDTVH